MQTERTPTARATIEGFDALLAGVKDGRPSAWDRCYRWLAPAVGGYLRTQGARDVDDLTSEVFLAMFRNIATFSGTESNFRSWVFVIAHRRLQDERRQRSRRPPGEEFDEAAMSRKAYVPGSGGEADEAALRSIGTERVVALCSRLVADQRDVVMLRIVGDLTVDQVAEVVGKSQGAVKQLQRRGFEALRRLVEHEGVPL